VPSAPNASPALDTFPRLLLHHADVRGDHPAFREKDLGIWQTWTWRQVAAEVRALACGLAAQGFERGMRLAIIGDNRPSTLLVDGGRAGAGRRRRCRCTRTRRPPNSSSC
jgi:long-subunit acyl-CoA synthetase (AMP-forming)